MTNATIPTVQRAMAASHMVVHRAATGADEHYYALPSSDWHEFRRKRILRTWLKRERKLEAPGELAFIDTPKGWKAL